MTTPTLSDLLAPQTAAQEKQTLLTRLFGKGFPVTVWNSGGVARTLIELFAAAFADVTSLLVSIASGGFVGLASGAWLVLLAKQLYDLDQIQASFTVGTTRLAAVSTSSGYTIVPGQIVVQSDSGLRYTNVSGGALLAGGTLDVGFQAESAGAAYNVGNGSINTLLTPLPGVTVTNPAVGTTGTWIATPGGDTWTSQQGTDQESDASLRGRCLARWPSLGSAPTQSVFDLWAKTASTQVTRTREVPDGTTPGQVDVYLAGAAGAVGSGPVATVQAYVNPRVPLATSCVVFDTQNEPIQVTGTMYIRNGFQTDAFAQASAAVTAYINGVDISGQVYESDVFEALQAPSGVRNVELTVLARVAVGSGVGDIDLSVISGTPRVATASLALTVVVV